jgi:hypothetical protein
MALVDEVHSRQCGLRRGARDGKMHVAQLSSHS